MEFNMKYCVRLGVLCAFLLAPGIVFAQGRDVRGGRIVIDDGGSDGTVNTLTIQLPASLAQDFVLTVPDPGSGTADLFLVPSGSAGLWSLEGNGSTTAGTNFLGTTDATALHLYVNSGTDNSLILNTNGSLQRDAGGNTRGVGAVDLQIARSNSGEVASGDSSIIAGGSSNTAIASSSTISGGRGNVAGGVFSTISGGFANGVLDTCGVVGGGQFNLAVGYSSTISGGQFNTTFGRNSAIAGGQGLTLDALAEGSFGFLGGNTGGVNNMTIDVPDIAVFGNTDMWLANNNNAASQLRYYEAYNSVGAFPGTANYSSFQAQAQTADIEYILPASAGLAGEVLSIDNVAGSTVTLAWALPVGPVSVGPVGDSGEGTDTDYVGAVATRVQMLEKQLQEKNAEIKLLQIKVQEFETLQNVVRELQRDMNTMKAGREETLRSAE